MKKLLVILLALGLLLCFTACKDNEEVYVESDTDTVSTESSNSDNSETSDTTPSDDSDPAPAADKWTGNY